MALEHVGYIDLPPHASSGGFDHAAVHSGRGLLYVAHTANDAVDVIDCTTGKYLRSIPHLPRVAGALVSETDDLVFTSNRGEDLVEMNAPIVGKKSSQPSPQASHPRIRAASISSSFRDAASRCAVSVALMPVSGEDSAVARLSGPQSSVFG
jgi:DNA-binding beta-propeller fold protein YncE